MKRQKERLFSKSTILLVCSLILFYFIGGGLYPRVVRGVKKAFTPKIQKEYHVEWTLSSSEGEVAKNISAENAYMEPISKAVALLIIMIVIIIISYICISILYKKGVRFKGISKVVKIIELMLVFGGIFVFVFGLNKTDKKYGIYKNQFTQESNLAYYPVEELPAIVDYLYEENFSEKIKMEIITNSEKIVFVLQVIIAISGALILPLKYCATMEKEKEDEEKEREDEEKKKKEMEKLANDLKSQIIDVIKKDKKGKN